MSTYKMTPAERRARAQSIVQNRENRSLYTTYIRQKEEYDRAIKAQEAEKVWADNEKNNQNFFVRGLSTVGDLVANVLTGAIKGLEGIVDLGIGVVGAVGGIFDKGFQDDVQDIIAYDATGEWIGDPIQEALRYSYLKEGGIIEGVASGIGQMLPAVAVTIATGGAGAPAAVSQIASLATMGVSAAGNATEEAFQEGANYYAGLGYGVASGVIEAATEKMFGGVTKGLTGAGVFDGITKSVADTGIKRIAKSALEEGVEEVVAELASPALKSIYKGSDAFSEYGEGEYWKNVGKAGIIGSMTALAYSGSVGYGLSKMGVGYVGKEADINDSLTEISSLREKATNLQAEDNLEGVNETKIAETTKKNYQNIERVLKSVNETKRASLIKKFSLENVFNADGSFNEQFSAWFNEAPIEAQSSGDGSEEASTPLASPKKTSYSFNLRGNEQTIQDDLDRMSEERAQAYLAEHTALGETLNIEQAREAVGKFAVLSTEMSETARTNRRKFNKALNALNNISGLKTSFVIVESNDTFNATVVDGTVKVGDRMYISADTFEDGSWTGALIHEYTHLEEGSKEYAEMYDFLQSDDILVEVETQEGTKKIPLWQKAQSAVLGKGYGFDQNQIKTISEKVQKGEELTADERKIYNAFATEVTAHETEYLLGNESFIDKIVAKDSSFAKRLIEKITHLKKAFEKSGEKKTRTELKQLQRAEKLYLNAARKAGDMRLVKFILAQNPELGEEEVDSNAEIRYNRKQTYKNISKQEYAIISSRIMEDNAGNIASDTPLPRYNTARSANYFYVYENFAPGEFGVLKQIRLTDNNRKYIQSIEAKIGENNGESTITSTSELNRVLQVLKNQTRNNRRNNVDDSEGRADSANGGLPLGESQGNGRRNTQKGNRNSQVKYSLKLAGETIGTSGKYVLDTKSAEVLKDIIDQNDIKNFLPNGLSKKFIDAIGSYGGFTYPRLYRGMEAEEFESIKRNGYIKSEGKYNFDFQQGETFFSHNVREAFSYATHFAPSGIREKFFEQGKPAYIVEVGNFADLNFKYNNVKESSTKKEVDVKYITRILELRYDETSGEVYIKDISIDGMNSVQDEAIHGEAVFVKDKTTGQLLFAVQDKEGYETRTYISQAEPGLLIDYEKLETAPEYDVEYRRKVANISGKESDLVPYEWKKEGEADSTIRYSLKDSDGNALSEEQLAFFQDSLARDNHGNLQVVYHGTMSGEFTVFDASKANPESDMGAGFYFSSSYDDVGSNYEEGGQDLDAKIERLAERIESEEDMDYEDAKIEAEKRLKVGTKLFEVYLDIKRPAYVGGAFDEATILFSDMESDLDMDDYENEDDYYEAQYEEREEKLQEIIDEVDRILSRQGITGYDEWVTILSEQGAFEGGITINDLKEALNGNMWDCYDENGNLATNEVVRAIIEALGYDGIIDNSVVEKWGYDSGRNNYMDGIDEETRRYIVFKPEQIKLTSNKKPTKNVDVRYSLKDSEGRTLTEAQRKFFAESQIRDGKGNLIPVYHGSDFDFNIFDKNKINTGSGNQWGEGFYFTFYGEVAGDYGDNIKEFYLNIKNPFEVLSEGAYRQVVDLFVKYGYEVDSEMVSKKYDNLVEGIEEDYDLIDILYSVVKTKRPMHEFTEIIKKEGYDGIIAGGEVIAFDTNQIKLTTNESPTLNEDIRYSLIDDPTAKPYFYELTDGQVKKLLANSTKMKVYSKVESEGIINDILGNYMSFGDSYGTLSGKAKSEVIDMLWRGLNTAEPGRQAKVALDVAEYIIQHSVVESMYDDPTLDVYMDTIALLKPYLHSIDLSHLKGEIKHRYDKDNSVYLLWGKRKGEKGFGADQIALELEELGFHIDAINEADIFFQIDEAYRSAVAHLKREAKQFLSSALSTEEQKELKQALAKQILLAFDKNGKPSKLAGILEEYAKKSKLWREKYYEERSKNKVLNRVLDKIQKIKDIKLGTFLNSSQFKNDIFKGSIERLANIKYRGNLNEAGTRNILEGLAEWYVKENPMLQGVFDEDIASMLQTLAKGEGKLTVDELKALENVVDYFKHFIENYNKVYRNGKYVDALPIAEKYVGIVRKNKPAKVGWLRKWFEKYTKTFADPMTLARYMDRYDEGFFTEMLENLRRGAVDASVMEMEMREPLEEFYKKNKKFLKDMTTKTIEYQGKQIPLAQAMLLYMSLNRDQAVLGLARSGFTYNDGKETIRVEGFALEEELTIEEVRVRAKEVQSSLASQFTEVEKEYISIAEKLFNETAKEAKRKTDILRRGYSNALEDYYVPIRRANVSQNVDTSTFFDEMNRVSNASFNRDTVRGAKNELFIEALDVVLGRHIKGVALYANLALAIDEYNLLYNLDIGGNPNQSVSVRTENETGIANWSEADAYFKKLISDIQGIPVVKGEGSRFMGWLRGGYAKYQLGANPKVWVTQLSSFAAAGSILDVSSIVKGVGVKASDVDKYCSLAKVRNSENAAALAQGVIEKTGKVGDVLMKPIGMVDRFVVMRLFGACQVQVEKNQGLKVGTEENKVEAGKLLERVILETQQNSMATERSSAMRSGSELMKTITMFSADSMKVIGRVVDSIGEVAVLKAKRKAATDATEIAELDKKIKEANKKARKSVGSLVSSAIFMALIAQAFRWLYAKDDEDENIVHNMGVDAVGNLLGGLPLIRDIYSRFAEGYDFDNYAYSAINDMFDSAESLFTTAGNIVQGDMDSREVASTIKNLLYAAGQIFGIPTRNVYNIAAGLTKRISPSTGYKLDDMFYKQSYRSDLAKAIEKGDEKMIATITGLMLDENIGGIDDSEARKAIDKLVQAGYNVIPRAVSDKITYDGVEYALTPGQVKEFEKVYLVANEALASLVKLPQFKDATDEVKAKAINFIYNVYYNLALQDFLGVDLETKSVLFAEAIDIEKLAIVVATANSLTADLDKKGKVIAGTRKAKVQSYVNSLQLKAVEKYMIMGYLGYTNTKGEVQVKAYINRLKLTKTEKEKLLEYSGY